MPRAQNTGQSLWTPPSCQKEINAAYEAFRPYQMLDGNLVQLCMKKGEASALAGISLEEVDAVLRPHVLNGTSLKRYLTCEIYQRSVCLGEEDRFFERLRSLMQSKRNKAAKPVLSEHVYTKGGYKIPFCTVTGRVYFAGAGTHIKIGYAVKPKSRMASLKNGAPSGVKLLAAMPGSIPFERYLHKRFHHLRASGEWFRAEPELVRFIRYVASWRYDPLNEYLPAAR